MIVVGKLSSLGVLFPRMYGVWGIIYYIAEIAEQEEEVRVGLEDLVVVDGCQAVVSFHWICCPLGVDKNTASRGNLPYL